MVPRPEFALVPLDIVKRVCYNTHMEGGKIPKDIWRDAYGIAVVGASNPRGVARTMVNYIDEGVTLRDSPALRAIFGHLEFLLGKGLGPEMDDLREVEAHKPIGW